MGKVRIFVYITPTEVTEIYWLSKRPPVFAKRLNLSKLKTKLIKAIKTYF